MRSRKTLEKLILRLRVLYFKKPAMRDYYARRIDELLDEWIATGK